MIFEDMIRIQIFESSDTKKIHIIDDQPKCRRTELWVRRSWAILINILQKEYYSGYGTKI